VLTKNKPGFFLLHASCLLALLIFIVGSMAQTLRTVLVTQKLITGTVTAYSTAQYEQRTIPSQQLVYQCGSLQSELNSRSFPYKTTTKLGATMYALA